MSQKKSLSDKFSTFLYGKPAPAINERSLHKKLDTILANLNHQETLPVTNANTDDLAEQVRKLAKTQFKTNTLQEKQLSQQETALENLQTALERLQTQQDNQVQQAIETARLDLFKSLLPSLDSLDAADDNLEILEAHPEIGDEATWYRGLIRVRREEFAAARPILEQAKRYYDPAITATVDSLLREFPN